MRPRLTPEWIWIAVLATFSGALVQRGGVILGFWGQAHDPNLAFSLIIVFSYVASLILCLRIAREHENSAAMHFAWVLFAGSCALSIVRHSIYCVMATGLYPNFKGESSYLSTQIPMAIALVLFFVGLLCMWNAFSALGLGFHSTRVDFALVTLMLLMLPPILFRDPESVPKFVTGWLTIFPFAGAILLPACAGIALFLRRTAMQMRGGETARFLLCLICYPTMRLFAMLVTVDPHLNAISPLAVFRYAVFHTAPVVFTLAVAYRWQITAKATAAMQSERANWNEFYPVETSIS
jgi:hypothetical protein